MVLNKKTSCPQKYEGDRKQKINVDFFYAFRGSAKIDARVSRQQSISSSVLK